MELKHTESGKGSSCHRQGAKAQGAHLCSLTMTATIHQFVLNDYICMQWFFKWVAKIPLRMRRLVLTFVPRICDKALPAYAIGSFYYVSVQLFSFFQHTDEINETVYMSICCITANLLEVFPSNRRNSEIRKARMSRSNIPDSMLSAFT